MGLTPSSPQWPPIVGLGDVQPLKTFLFTDGEFFGGENVKNYALSEGQIGN